MKQEYLKLLRQLKKQVEATENCKEKELMLLGIDNFIKTIKDKDVTEEDLKAYLERELKEERK
jgi:hypothetical protein